jgi:type II secretory pathway pseudopilin PulG
VKLKLPKTRVLEQRSGFTLAEMLVVTASLVILIGSVIICNLFGLSMSVRQQIWLSASDDSAQALGKLMTDIRSGASNYVGTGSNWTTWARCADGTPHTGNSLMIYLGTTNSGTNIPFVLYWYDTVSNVLWRTNYTGSNYGDFKMVSANPITNDNPVFTEEDYLGNVLTNTIATPIIQVYLSFTKLQNPQVAIAPGSPVDFYQIITTVASRNRQ